MVTKEYSDYVYTRPDEDRQSPTYGAGDLGKQVAAKHSDTILLTLGELDISPSNRFLAKCKEKAAKDGIKLAAVPGDAPAKVSADELQGMEAEDLAAGCNYPPARGTPEFRAAAAAHFMNESGNTGVTANDVIVSLGGKAVLALIGRTFKKGDEVIVAGPGWPTNYDIWRDEVKVIEVNTHGRGLMTADEVREAKKRHPQAKAVLINDPCNPTGARYTPEEREEVMKACMDTGLMAIVDDPYGALTYNNATMERGDNEKALFTAGKQVVVNSVSKVYARPDLRVGWAITKNKELLNAMEFGIQTLGASAQIEEQNKAQLLLAYGKPFVKWTEKRLEERAKLFADGINGLEAKGKQVLTMNVPKGAIYGQIDTSRLEGATYTHSDGKERVIKTPADVAEWMRDQVHAPPVDGSPFYAPGSPAAKEGWFLRTVLTAKDKLAAVCKKLGDTLQDLQISWTNRGDGEDRKAANGRH